MTFLPNMRRALRTERVARFPYIDNLFDYAGFLADAERKGGIGQLPAPMQGSPIAVVGGGIAGLVAAYELCRAGATNVQVYEAEAAPGRLHGRTWSEPFSKEAPEYLAELGAMRFPPSEVGLFHYLDKFRIPYTPNFPDPGHTGVPTQIHYQGRNYPWSNGGNPPAPFDKLYAGWGAFVAHGATVGGVRLMAPQALTELLHQGALAPAREAWQAYINVFANCSFYNGLVKVFAQPGAPGGPWNMPTDFEIFGALGVGSGGFGPLYPITFLDIVRLVVDELETDQQFVPGGIQSVVSALAQAVNGRVKVNQGKRLIGLARERDGVTLHFDDKTTQHCARAVLAVSSRAAQIAGLADFVGTDGFLTAEQSTALRNVHMTNSSKVFVMTASKFWLRDKTLPWTIQSDTLTRGTYCLDYTPQQGANGYGVVLLSYTWEDDSTKQMALTSKEQRVKRLVADIARFNPAFAEHVVPVKGDYATYTKVIDWQAQPGYFGAFKLSLPGTDNLTQQLFFQFQCAGTQADRGLYLAGDSYSYTGGWAESAVQTALNSVCAVIRSLGGKFKTDTNPIDGMNATAYNYSVKSN